MRRILMLGFGSVELVIAVMLVRLAWQMPSRRNVDKTFTQAQRMTHQAGEQIHQVRDQVRLLRRPELQEMAVKLQSQLKTVTETLKDQRVDFETVAAVSDALEGVAGGLEGMSETLNPEHVAKLGDGLGTTADFLDKQLIPAAEQAAKQLESSTEQMEKDAVAGKQFFEKTAVDLKAVRDVHDSLDEFANGLSAMKASFHVQRLKKLKEGFQGMYTALSTGADQVQRLASYTYPVITFDGLTPEIEKRRFWPEGGKIAAGLRKAGKGVQAANEELDDTIKKLPELEKSLNASHKIIESTRNALAVALKQQDNVKPLLKLMPKHAAQLAEKLPKLGKDLALVLHSTKKFGKVATALRQAQTELQNAAESWPKLRQTLLSSAKLLKVAQQQLNDALEHKEEYEKGIEQSVNLGEGFAQMLPLMSHQMLMQLDEQEESLDDLGSSLQEMEEVIPVYGETVGDFLDTGRWLLWLIAALAALHGGVVLYQQATIRKRSEFVNGG